MSKSKLIFLYVSITFVGLILGFLLFKRNQYLSRQARELTHSGAVDFRITQPNSIPKEYYRVDIMFRTGKDNLSAKEIGALTLKFKIVSDNSNIYVSDLKGKREDKILLISELKEGKGWEVPINRVYSDEKGNTVVEFAAITPTYFGYNSSEFKPLASFYLYSKDSGRELSVEFDKENSVMLTKDRPVVNILKFEGNIALTLGK